jgi:hypothetical protein
MLIQLDFKKIIMILVSLLIVIFHKYLRGLFLGILLMIHYILMFLRNDIFKIFKF